MARQAGPYFITGTIGGLTFYSMGGRYYVRRKSSLSKHRVKTDRVFAGLRHHSDLLGIASSLSSVVYQSLPRERRDIGLFRRMTGKAKRWLEAGYPVLQIKEMLVMFTRQLSHEPESVPALPSVKDPVFYADQLLAVIFSTRLCQNKPALLPEPP
jgi:hypothetical protein